MKPNQSIEFSQHIYRQLLRLYPQSYRTTYETEMFHVFTDQCREAYQKRGGLGLLFLWLRTLVDVGKTVVIEHVSAPNAQVGLLEAMPNAPLPWKGVLLVLIPGLVFFISQIEQVISDNDWFFIVYYRAAFVLIVPVLFVWAFTRRFPVWGLIPLGLLYGTLQSYSPIYLLGKLPFMPRSKVIWKVFDFALDPYYFVPVLACLILICGLVWYSVRRRQFSRTAWAWLALYGVLLAFQLVAETYRSYERDVFYFGANWESIKLFFLQTPISYLYSSLPFLLLVFIGKLFARKHGGLSFLLLLGYLLPTVVFGRYGGEWTDYIPFYVVALVALIYRFTVALVAPVWLVREASTRGRQRAASIPVAVAIFFHMALNIAVSVLVTRLYAYQMNWLDFVLAVWNQVLVAAGLGLAVALYLPKEKDTVNVSPPLITVTE
ncbi:MAG: hypothetical protein IPP66_01745 [Anaerolineales bacterium]|nr:hypothetical protein [Anaerolineales bacterium]